MGRVHKSKRTCIRITIVRVPTNHFPASVENKAVHCFTFIQQTGVFSTIKTDHTIFVCLI